MRVMAMVRATRDSENEALPSRQLMEDMSRFNEELAKAGVLLAGEGLKASRHGARVLYSGAKRAVVDGPFAESKELIAGFWLWQVRSLDEAIEWARRCPNPFEGDIESIVEIRPVIEAEDFGEEFTQDMRAQEALLRAKVGSQ